MWHGHNVSLLTSPLNYRSFTELCGLCGRDYRHQSQLAFFPPVSDATRFLSFTALRPTQTWCELKRLLLVEELEGQSNIKWSEVWGQKGVQNSKVLSAWMRIIWISFYGCLLMFRWSGHRMGIQEMGSVPDGLLPCCELQHVVTPLTSLFPPFGDNSWVKFPPDHRWLEVHVLCRISL